MISILNSDPFSSVLYWFSEHSSVLVSGGVLFVLLILSALISGAEVALFSLSQTDINAQKENGDSNGNLIFQMLKNPKKLLATILIANNLVNISIVLVFAPIGEKLFGNFSEFTRLLFEVGLVTFFILLFGEILPKIYATRNNVKFARFVVKFIKLLEVIFTPLTLPMQQIINKISQKLGKQKTSLSVGQLSQALELASSGDTTQEEQKILKGIVSFGNIETREVMRPRMDIFALNETLSFEQMLQQVKENGYSRVPVFKENIDQITGVIHTKDLLPYISENNFDWSSIKRKPFFIPENKKLDDLLNEFQSKKIHLAIVVDEYGGTSGIITLEDIIEQIVGDIRDEYDVDDSFFTKINEKTYLFDGKTTMKDFYRVMNIRDLEEEKFETQRGEAETIAGFFLEIAGVFPSKGQSIIFENYSIIIDDLDKKRIKQLKIVRND